MYIYITVHGNSKTPGEWIEKSLFLCWHCFNILYHISVETAQCQSPELKHKHAMKNTIEQNADNARKLQDYAHKANCTAGRIAAADRAAGLVATNVTGKSTVDRFTAAAKRTVQENEHLAFLKAVALIERLSGVKVADCLAFLPEGAATPIADILPAKGKKAA